MIFETSNIDFVFIPLSNAIQTCSCWYLIGFIYFHRHALYFCAIFYMQLDLVLCACTPTFAIYGLAVQVELDLCFDIAFLILGFLFTGFCGETEEEHKDTLSLIRAVGYDMAYMFAYSMREKTHAHRNYVDDVADEVKQRRLTELIEAFRESTGQCYDSQIGTIQLVLVEGPNKRAPDTELIGKSDRGHRVSFTNLPVPNREDSNNKQNPVIGDYVEVRILKSTRASLFGEAHAISKLSLFYNNVERDAVACASC